MDNIIVYLTIINFSLKDLRCLVKFGMVDLRRTRKKGSLVKYILYSLARILLGLLYRTCAASVAKHIVG